MQVVENQITINVPHGENGLQAFKTNNGQAQAMTINVYKI